MSKGRRVLEDGMYRGCGRTEGMRMSCGKGLRRCGSSVIRLFLVAGWALGLMSAYRTFFSSPTAKASSLASLGFILRSPAVSLPSLPLEPGGPSEQHPDKPVSVKTSAMPRDEDERKDSSVKPANPLRRWGGAGLGVGEPWEVLDNACVFPLHNLSESWVAGHHRPVWARNCSVPSASGLPYQVPVPSPSTTSARVGSPATTAPSGPATAPSPPLPASLTRSRCPDTSFRFPQYESAKSKAWQRPAQDADGYLHVTKDWNCTAQGVDGAKFRQPIKRTGPAIVYRNGMHWYDQERYTINCTGTGSLRNKSFAEAYFHVAAETIAQFEDVKQSQISIDLLVLESTSLQDFQKFMPKSIKVMNKMGFHRLEGYSKVGENTLPNTFAMFTGGDFASATQKGLPASQKLLIEEADFFWRHQPNGTASLYNVDVKWEHFYHYFGNSKLGPGLRVAIARFFLRPLQWIHEKILFARERNGLCRAVAIARNQLRIMEDFMRWFTDKLHFSYTKIMRISHDNSAKLVNLDDEFSRILKRLKKSGALNKTALIIVGDHGQRISGVARTLAGSAEASSPVLAIRLPPSFARRRPKALAALRANRHRLTTPFDLHNSLLELAQGAPAKTPLGRSLFRPIARKRSCAEAGVPEKYCVCLLPYAAPAEFHGSLAAARGQAEAALRAAGHRQPFPLLNSTFLAQNDKLLEARNAGPGRRRPMDHVFLDLTVGLGEDRAQMRFLVANRTEAAKAKNRWPLAELRAWRFLPPQP